MSRHGRALDAQTAATGDLLRISQAQRYHQDADMLHDTIRADVYHNFLPAEFSHQTPQQVAAQLRADVEQFRDDLVNLSEVTVTPAVNQANEKISTLADAYVDAANETVESARRSRAEGAATMPDFDAAFEALRAPMQQQAAVLEQLTSGAKRSAAMAKDTARTWIVMAAIVINIVGALLVWLLSRSIRSSLRRVRNNAQAMAQGDLSKRNNVADGDEVGELARSIDTMANNLQSMLGQIRTDSERGAFGNQLVEALEMADTETEAHTVIARAMATVSARHPMELLLADSSKAHLERATAHPEQGAPGCGVESPFSCVAVRRGNPVVFSDSEALNACPRLRGRACGPVSAVCVPVSIMGRALGVLHSTGEVGAPMAAAQVARLTTLGIQAGARIGTVRAFERTQVQASTDGLTGLANRRTLETKLRELLVAGRPFALVIADLDHFKHLNDTLGHQAGDIALRQFAEMARAAIRDTDLVARWGGEEFTFVLPDATAQQALEFVDRLRLRLAESQLATGSTVFTSSFGIADSSMARSMEELLKIADLALYRAKDDGRDRGVIGGTALLAPGAERHATEHHAQVDLHMLASSAG